MEMNAIQVTDLIKKTTDVKDRVMVVRDPDSKSFKKIPDELLIKLEPGKLGVTFAGKRAEFRSFKEDSQLAGKVPFGLFVNEVRTENGYSQSGMNTNELVGLLGFLNDQEGRILVLRNKKLEPSPKKEIFPEKLELELDPGKVGTSFRGATAWLSRIHETSQLKGKAFIGMVLESITIEGGEIFTKLSAEQAAKILADTKNVEGRILVF